MQIAVAGTGYVGLSIATLLAQHHEVLAVDIVPEKVDMINHRQSPIQDEYIEKYFAEKELNLTATLDAEQAYKKAEFVVIAAPTNYDSQKNYFDTSAVETVIEATNGTNDRLVYEASDMIYHLIVLLTSKGLRIEDLAEELVKRHKE
jgi:UDPglucose 6-dehydrogenase